MRIGVDIGGTKIEAIVLGPNGTELVRERIASPQGNYAATLASVKNLVDIVETRATRIKRTKKPATIGIGIPGTISPVTGLVKNANSTWLIGHQLDQDLSEIFERPIKVANDANCFAMSEAIDGAAMGHQTVFAVILAAFMIGSDGCSQRLSGLERSKASAPAVVVACAGPAATRYTCLIR